MTSNLNNKSLFPKLIAILVMLLFFSGCAIQGNSRIYGAALPMVEGNQSLPLVSSLRDSVVIIYNHGSLSEDKTDPCFPGSSFMPGGLPQLVKSFAHKQIARHPVTVYVLCSKIPGRLKLRHTQDNLKIRLRVEEITVEVKRLRKAGIPGRNIFLAGHSAGGWASLLIERENPELVNGVIAFSPAFAGVKHRRNEKWQRFRDEHQAYLESADELSALVYAFQSDPYNSREDLGFLSEIPGVSFKALPTGNSRSEFTCYRGHRAAFRRCFAEAHTGEVFDFIESRFLEAR